jgi:hypothetical protein
VAGISIDPTSSSQYLAGAAVCTSPGSPALAKSAVDVIGTAFEHTKQQLTQPFRFGQWARLALLGLATGEISSGGGCSNFRGLSDLPSRFPSHAGNFVSDPDNPLSRLGLDWAAIASILVVVVVGFLVLGLVWIYVASISRFVLFESVLRKHCELGAGWQRWQAQGSRFFGWQLALSILSLAVAAVLFIPLLLPVLATMRNHQQPGPAMLLALVPMFLVFGAFALVMMLIGVLAKDFVVPLMAVDNIGVLEGWRRLVAMMRADGLAYAGYIGMKIVLAIGSTVVFGIVGATAAVVLLVPMGILGVVTVIIAKGVGLGWNAFTITAAIVAGVIVLAVLLYVVALVCVPVAVFFPAYAMYFFAERYPALYAVLYPPSPTPPPLLVPEPVG